jgi:hypothetical protein
MRTPGHQARSCMPFPHLSVHHQQRRVGARNSCCGMRLALKDGLAGKGLAAPQHAHNRLGPAAHAMANQWQQPGGQCCHTPQAHLTGCVRPCLMHCSTTPVRFLSHGWRARADVDTPGQHHTEARGLVANVVHDLPHTRTRTCSASGALRVPSSGWGGSGEWGGASCPLPASAHTSKLDYAGRAR